MANEIKRRDTLTTDSAVQRLWPAITLVRPERVLGANNRVCVAMCGVHGRGNDHLEHYSKIPNVQIAARGDIDETLLRKCVAQIEKMGCPDRSPMLIEKLWRKNPSTPSPLLRPTTGIC